MTDLLNPYIAGAPVVAADMFFGRSDIFEWVERSLMGKYVDHILVIHGQRRVGKTSILKQLPNHLPDRYIQVFFDLQGRTTTSPGRFFWWLSREISRAMHSSHQAKITIPERTEFEENPELLFTRYLPEVQSALGERDLLLTFDEFDTLSEPGVGETLALPLIQTLRRMMELEGLSFIYSIGSSGQKLENMQARYTEFFKSALYRKISFLELETCRELITEPVAGVLAYDPEAVSRIYQVTAGHPYFTQLVCHELFSRCQQSGVREIQRADVDGVLEQVIERGTVNLKFVWDEADDLEKWVLACLARSDECRDPAELGRTLVEQRVRFSEPDLNRALVHLREKDVLGADNRFVVYLLRVWLRQNRPLERVREELVEVSPIANRFIEIGEEYWVQGEREGALESFRQALEVDPGSVKARVHLGSLLLEVGQEREAVAVFEAALEIDGDDINALRGYCKVQLKLGDRARALGEDQAALESYQAILIVNPEYQLARERLASMYQERAEAHLLEGNDEAALLAFQRALSYTPQDADLAERFVQIKGERMQGAVANLTARAEEAAAADEWDAALTALRDALLIVGEDAELEQRLAQVKAGQRAYLLRTLPDAARRYESREDWEQACATWRAYLARYPDDQPDAEIALAHSQQMLDLQGQYAEAQAAMDVKDYPTAIQLLQGIVQVDPSYKDTSHLLSRAIKASHKSTANILRYSWYAVPLVFILLSFGAYFVFGGRFQLPGFLFAQSPQGTPTEAILAGPDVSPKPTRTIAATNPSADQTLSSISSGTPYVSISPQVSATLPAEMMGCLLTNAAIPRDAPGENAAEVAETGELDAYTPVSVRNFVADEQGDIWGYFNQTESDLQGISGYVLAGNMSIGCFECETLYASETKLSDLNDSSPSSGNLDFVDAGEPVKFTRIGTLVDGSTWLYIFGSGASREDTLELGWISALNLARTCFKKLGFAVCIADKKTHIKWNPNRGSGGISYMEIGDRLHVSETIVGTDGDTWYRIVIEDSGYGGWVPEYAVSAACKQDVLEP